MPARAFTDACAQASCLATRKWVGVDKITRVQRKLATSTETVLLTQIIKNKSLPGAMSLKSSA